MLDRVSLLALLLPALACGTSAVTGTDGGPGADGGSGAADAGARGDAGAPAVVGLSFHAALTIDFHGGQTSATLYGRLDPAQGVGTATIAFSAWGPSAVATARRSGDTIEISGLSLDRGFFSARSEGWSLFDHYDFDRLSLTLSGDQIALSGAGNAQQWETTDVYDEGPFTVQGSGGADLDPVVAIAETYQPGGAACSPFSPIGLWVSRGLSARGLEEGSRVEAAGSVLPLGPSILDDLGAGFADGISLVPAKGWPLGAELKIQLGGQSLGGQSPAPIMIPGPGRPASPLQAGAPALTAWVGAPAPMFEGNALLIQGLGAWARVPLTGAPQRLGLRVTYLLNPTGVSPNDNPEWVRKIFGWSLTVGDEQELIATVNRDLVAERVSPAQGGAFALPTELIEIELPAGAGREVVVELRPRSFSRSPATAYGFLLLESVELR